MIMVAGFENRMASVYLVRAQLLLRLYPISKAGENPGYGWQLLITPSRLKG